MNEIIQSLEANATNGKENFCYISENKLNALKELSKREYQENQELKKQLEENQNPLKGIFAQVNDDTLLRDCGNMNAEISELKNQQKEFIEYLEKEIEKTCNSKNMSKCNLYQEILSKYQEIIGKENDSTK